MKEWKSGPDSGFGGDGYLWGNPGGTSARVYCLRLGSREFYITRGEIILTIIVGIFGGLIFAAGDAGYLKLPEGRTRLGHYEPPAPRLLGSTEHTRPEAGNPNGHFVDGGGRGSASVTTEAGPSADEFLAPVAADAAIPDTAETP